MLAGIRVHVVYNHPPDSSDWLWFIDTQVGEIVEVSMEFLVALGMSCAIVFGGAWLWGKITRRTVLSIKAHKEWLKIK